MKTSTDTVNIMCNESQIILLQLRALVICRNELPLISQLTLNFSDSGLSSLCLEDKLITGRPL